MAASILDMWHSDPATLTDPATGLFQKQFLTSCWVCASDAEIIDNVVNTADKANDIDNENKEGNFLKNKKINFVRMLTQHLVH